jgi:hypothetical protein
MTTFSPTQLQVITEFVCLRRPASRFGPFWEFVRTQKAADGLAPHMQTFADGLLTHALAM